MRKVIFGGANSLDNYFARKDDSVDWLLWNEEVSAIVEGYWRNIDTVLMGRKTFAVAQGNGSGANPYAGMKTYVFSRTLQESPPGIEIISDNAADFVKNLKHQEGKDICVMGGGDFARTL